MESVSATWRDPINADPPLGQPGPRRLVWPIKESLLLYLRALPDAVISGPHSENGFAFEASCDEAGVIRSHGTIRLTAHDGQLDIVLGDLEVVHDGVAGVLSARTDAETGERRDIARLGPVDRRGDLCIIDDVALTHEGATLFQGHYGAYTRMAPVTIFPQPTSVGANPE